MVGATVSIVERSGHMYIRERERGCMEAKTKLVQSEFRVKNMRHGGDSLRLVSCLLPRQIRSIPSLLPIPSSRQMTGTRYGVSRSTRYGICGG